MCAYVPGCRGVRVRKCVTALTPKRTADRLQAHMLLHALPVLKYRARVRACVRVSVCFRARKRLRGHRVPCLFEYVCMRICWESPARLLGIASVISFVWGCV